MLLEDCGGGRQFGTIANSRSATGAARQVQIRLHRDIRGNQSPEQPEILWQPLSENHRDEV